MLASPLRTRLVFESTLFSPLGSISLAGFIRDSRGVPLEKQRVFGNFALVYLLQGSGRMRVARGPVLSMRAGDLLHIYPEIPHGYGPGPGEKWSEFYLVFNGSVFDLWRSQGLLDPSQPIRSLPRISRWLPQLEAIVSPKLPDTGEGMTRRICLLQKFLADILPAKEGVENSGSPSWLDLARRRLLETPEVSPQSVARSLGLSYETFRKDFARQTGCPPVRYRAERLIERARQLMLQRHLSNKEIAESLGFYDEFHFSRRFRLFTGQSPREYRQNAIRRLPKRD